MVEFGDQLFNLKFETRKKLAPILYKSAFSSEQKLKHLDRFDNLASGLISLIDSNPTVVKGRLSLDDKQMRELLLLGKLSSEKILSRKPVELDVRSKQRLLSTVYVGSESQSIESNNSTLASAFDILARHEVRLVVSLNVEGDQPVSAGVWGGKGTSKSDSVHFMFLSEKPTRNSLEKLKGSYLDLRQTNGTEINIYGDGNRIDLFDSFKLKGQNMTSTETFLYLGEFDLKIESGVQKLHCWGHNTNTHSKSIPVTQSVGLSNAIKTEGKV